MEKRDDNDKKEDTLRIDMTLLGQLMMNQFPDPILILKNEIIIDCNYTTLKMFGYSDKSQLLGREINQLFYQNSTLDTHKIQFKYLLEAAKAQGNKRSDWMFCNHLKESIYAEILLISLAELAQNCFYLQIRDIRERILFQEELLIQKSKFQQLYENSPEAVVMLDNNDLIVSINRAFEETFQYRLDEIKGKPINKLIVPDHLIEEASQLSSDVLAGEAVRTETVRKRKDGTLIDVSVVGYHIINNQRQIGIYGIYQDITARKESERNLNLFAKVLENNTEGVIITDRNAKIQWVNKAFTDITGYSKTEVVNQRPSILKSGKHSKDFYQRLWESILTLGKWQGEIWNKRKNGEVFAENLSIFAIKDQNNQITHFASILSDITANKAKEEKINYLAFRDSLTGLYNRAMFGDRLNLELAKAKRQGYLVAVLFIDLDEFKSVNDTHGHGVGDLLLKQIADRLLSATRETDTVARIGGDEFIVILPDIKEAEQIRMISEKLLKVFEAPWQIDDKTFYIAASIGISIYPLDGIKPQELIQNADIAMYKAKEKGHNQYEFYTNISHIIPGVDS